MTTISQIITDIDEVFAGADGFYLDSKTWQAIKDHIERADEIEKICLSIIGNDEWRRVKTEFGEININVGDININD